MVVDVGALARAVADRARPGEQVEAIVAYSRSTIVRVHAGSVESFTRAEHLGAGIRVVAGGRQGFAHCGTHDPGVIDETLADARENARFAEPDEFAGLAVPDDVAVVDRGGWDESVLAVAESAKIDRALVLERHATTLDPRVSRARTVSYADSAGEVAIATSTGIVALDRAVRCSLSASVIATAAGESTTGWAGESARRFDELDDAKVAGDAVARAARMLGATKPQTARLTVVLEPRQSAALLGVISGMLSAERVVKGRTPFCDRIGEQIASSLLSLADDPTDTRSLGADTCDGEGLASRRTPLLVDGVLQGYLNDSYTARRLGSAPTASAIRGTASTPTPGARLLVVTPGGRTAEELLARVSDGVFVTALSGLHSGVNAVSGDFSVGVEGLRIRGGQLAEPIREATLASSIQRLLIGISGVGSDLEWLPGGSGLVTLVIDDVALSGA